MPSPTTFLVISLAVYGFLFLLTRVALHSKSFNEQPSEDQQRSRKQFKWSLALFPVVMAGTYLLLGAPASVLRYMPLLIYLLAWFLAIWLLWRSYCLGIRRDVRLVKSLSGKPLPYAASYVTAFAIANLLSALGIMAILVAIPVFRLPFNAWAALFTVVSSTYTLFAWRYERKSAA